MCEFTSLVTLPIEEEYKLHYQGEDETRASPIWKITNGGQHISFYGQTTCCAGATPWCKAHCYLKTKPAVALEGIHPIYRIHEFKKPITRGYAKDFLAAKYVTILASGSIEECPAFDNMDDLYLDNFDAEVSEIISYLPMWHPEKNFRFFIRSSPSELYLGSCEARENSKLIFSADVDTDLGLIGESCEHDAISLVAVVKHSDNEPLIQFLRSKLPVIDCANCKGKYLCFNSREKSLLLLDWIGGEDE